MAIALIVAAGRGERLGTDRPKAFTLLAGRPMLGWSIDAFREWDSSVEVVVAVPQGWSAASQDESEAIAGCTVCEGGAERSHSVRAALAAAADQSADQTVFVHDAARPLVSVGLIEALSNAVAEGDGAAAWVAAVPVADTIRVADADQRVTGTPDRSSLWAMQTPQAFRRDRLQAALDQDDAVLAAATDDAALVEALGGRIRLVQSTHDNFKVTSPVDLELAELMITKRAGAS